MSATRHLPTSPADLYSSSFICNCTIFATSEPDPPVWPVINFPSPHRRLLQRHSQTGYLYIYSGFRNRPPLVILVGREWISLHECIVSVSVHKVLAVARDGCWSVENLSYPSPFRSAMQYLNVCNPYPCKTHILSFVLELPGSGEAGKNPL